MPLHLIKLCVGVEEVGEIREWCSRRRPIVHTRQTPKRAAELLEGGSLYWVIKGVIQVRQPIVAVETLGAAGATRCEIALGQTPFLTTPQPRRAFQGWRYLTEADAPADLPTGLGEGVPTDLARKLLELGAG